MTHYTDHLERALVIAGAAAIGVDQSISVLAQAIPGLTDVALVQLAEKGGGWVVLLIVLFFYRRDYVRLTTGEAVARQELVAAAKQLAVSELKLTVALAANTEVIRSIVAQRNGERYEEWDQNERRHP